MNNIYECKRCGYECKKKYTLQAHLKKKKECLVKREDISREELLDELNTKGKFICENCQTSFKSAQQKYIHKRDCKVDIKEKRLKKLEEELLEMKEQMKSLMKDKEEKPKIINNTTNNNTTNNITNYNITVNSTFKDNFTYIPEERIGEILREDNMIIEFLKEVNYNKEHPENWNILVLEDTCFVYNGLKYIKVNTKTAIEQKIRCHKDYLLTKAKTNDNKLDINYQYNGLTEWSRKEKEELLNEIKKEMYNNREEVKRMKEKKEEMNEIIETS